jgi:flagellar motor switch protein FliM
MADDKVLSQSEIDALMESVAPARGTAKEKVAPSQTKSPHPQPSSLPTADNIKALTEKITELTNRLDRLEKAVSRIKYQPNGSLTMAQFAENFRCTSCNSQGFLAFFVKCTHCGQVKLWGSWPTK